MPLVVPADAPVNLSWGIALDAIPETLLMTAPSDIPVLAVGDLGGATAITNPATLAANNAVFQLPSPASISSGLGRYADLTNITGPGVISFMTDSADFEVIVGAGSTQNVPINILVNGKVVSATMSRQPAGPGAAWRLRLTFAAKALRRIDVVGVISTSGGFGVMVFGGLTTAATDTVEAVGNFSPDIWCVIGDSMTIGTGGPSSTGLQSLAQVTMTALGVPYYLMFGVGGTGYVNNAAGVPAKLFAAPQLPFTRVLVLWGYNDSAALKTAVEVQTAAATLFDAIHAALPSAKIYAALTINPNMLNSDNASTGVAAAAASRAAFVRTLPASTYITGTGHSGAPAAVGNRDLVIGADGVHPTPYGHTYLGLRLAQDLIRLRGVSP